MSASDMQPMPAIPVEILLRHSAGLRALARGLLGDEHAAEDVVQETLAVACATPPGDAGRIGGWLRRVTRKRALKRLRGEARRREREERASRSELLAPTDELAAQREILRQVVDAVLGLAEPYQGVVLLRFFEDLPPREIAQRRGVPVATVNSQLQRALAMLRGSLDAQTGGERRRWALALASVTGRPRRTTLGPDPSHPAAELARRAMEGIAVHWKLSIGLAGALLAGAGAVTLRGLEPQDAELTAAREASAQASVQVTGAREERAGDARIDDAAPAREPLGTAAAVAEKGDAIDEASRFELEVLVVDEHDQPRNGATVLAAPPLHPLNQLGSTGPDGRLHVAWMGPAAATTLFVGVSQSSTPERGLRRIELRAGEPARLRLVLRGSPVRSMGRMREGSAVGPALAPHAPAIRALPLGELTCFAAPVPYEREEREAIARNGNAARPPAGSQQTLDGLRGLGYASSDEKAPEVRKVVAHGFVLDEKGEPVRAALVTARCDPSARTVRTDETGAYSIELPAGKLLALRAGGGDLGLANASFELDAEALRQQVAWSPLLDRGLEVRGRLRTSAERDTGGWLAVFEGGPESALWQDATLCAAGRFAIPNLPAGTGRLLFFETRLEPFPFHVVEGALPAVPSSRSRSTKGCSRAAALR